MNPTLRNILAIIAGFIGGSFINGFILSISADLIPPPEGANVTSMEQLRATMHLFEPRHFIMPFLAHALGTLAGACIAAWIAASHALRYAMIIGILFLIAGLTNIYLLPSPLWFSLVDAIGAYLPMAYLAGRLFTRKQTN